jgi:multidrug resistance efflux pump
MAAKRAVLRKLIPLLVLLAAAAAAFAYMREQRKPKPLVLAGTLEARTVNVGSLVGGRVVRVHVDEGNAVVAGQVLVTLETETIDRQIAEQQAAIAATRAQLAKALAGPRNEEIRRAAAVAENDERERRRLAALYDAGVVARALLDDATTKAKTSAEDLRILQKGTRMEDIAVAKAEVARQERRLATLMKQHDETVVRSTVTGTVQSFALRPGDIVAPNQTVAEILEPSQLWVRIYVPETLLGLVRLNMPAKVRVDTYPNVWFNGRVAAVSSEGEYTPRNVQTRAQRAEQVYGVKVIADPDPRLKAGMAAEVDLGVKGRAE